MPELEEEDPGLFRCKSCSCFSGLRGGGSRMRKWLWAWMRRGSWLFLGSGRSAPGSLWRRSVMGFVICVCLLLLLGSSSVVAQTPSPARALDAMLQEYAYRAFVRPHTGIVYNGSVPGNLTGVAVSALRLRSGSLRRKGFSEYFEFSVPTGVIVQPFVERVVLVYHNLGELSEQYYPLPGYTYLSPVLGLLVYDAANLSAVGLPELTIVASGSPISVNFNNVRAVPPGGQAPQCVWFDLDGVPQFRDLEASNICTTYRRGHFSIVVNSSEVAPAPEPSGAIAPPIPTDGRRAKGSSNAWKIAVGVVGSAIALGLLACLLLRFVRYKREKKLEVMDRNAEVGEILRMAQVGRTQAPVALGTRTQPVIESEYVA